MHTPAYEVEVQEGDQIAETIAAADLREAEAIHKDRLAKIISGSVTIYQHRFPLKMSCRNLPDPADGEFIPF